MKIAATSDIHGRFDLKWPRADVLILAGDLLRNFGGSKEADARLQRMYVYDTFIPFLEALVKVYGDVIVVPGNHDCALQLYKKEMCDALKQTGAYYLIDEGVEIQGKKFWGSPWTPWFGGQRWVFNFPPDDYGEMAKQIYAKIPADTEVLVTHGPPAGILDSCPGGNVGCIYLKKRVRLVQPKLHIFGHIHESYGTQMFEQTICANVAHMNWRYKPVNKPKVFSI